MEELMNKMWQEDGKLDEVNFCKALISEMQLIWADGSFFSTDGRIQNDNLLRQAIYERICPYYSSGVSRKVDNILQVLRLEAGKKQLPLQETTIHLANGTYHLTNGFTEDLQICRYRLPVSYRPNLPNPKKWLEFLQELLEPQDIDTLQEYMGYCLIPTNIAQKMLMIIGRGGEGKSRVGVVMRALLGDNMNQGSIHKVETNPFARADLEHKLLLVDDDVNLMKLPATHNLKSIITAENPMDLERKGVQSYQGKLYCRFMAFGNGGIASDHDASVGFYRRQIILTAKPRNPRRRDDPFLGRYLVQEADQIFLWCLSGLYRLMENDFQFTLSARARDNLRQAYREGNPLAAFMGSAGYFVLEGQGAASSRQLYAAYRDWSSDNNVEPMTPYKFSEILRLDADYYGLKYDYNIPIGNGRRARGFRGIKILSRI